MHWPGPSVAAFPGEKFSELRGKRFRSFNLSVGFAAMPLHLSKRRRGGTKTWHRTHDADPIAEGTDNR